MRQRDGAKVSVALTVAAVARGAADERDRLRQIVHERRIVDGIRPVVPDVDAVGQLLADADGPRRGDLREREIRATDASVPVVIITGGASEQLHRQCERLGVHDYLAKPVDYDALLTSIKLALEIPAQEAEVLTLRLPARVISELSEIDSNLERAIMRLLGERRAKRMKAKE